MPKMNLDFLPKLPKLPKLSNLMPAKPSAKPSLWGGKFKYQQKELDRLLTKGQIKPEVYRYLSKEVQEHGATLASNSKTFERLFKMLIKSKARGSRMNEEKVRQYEAVRDVWASRKKRS